MKLLVNTAGWYGAVAIVAAYILLSFGFILATSLVYLLLNLTGALGIVVDSLYKKDYQPGMLNVVWAQWL